MAQNLLILRDQRLGGSTPEITGRGDASLESNGYVETQLCPSAL